MTKTIAYCGINCAECPAYLAHSNDDDELRAKTAKQWSKEFGAELKPQDINCVGCLETTGLQIGHCSQCEIRKCATERKLANCAHCPDYACETLAKFLEMVPGAKANLDEIRASL